MGTSCLKRLRGKIFCPETMCRFTLCSFSLVKASWGTSRIPHLKHFCLCNCVFYVLFVLFVKLRWRDQSFYKKVFVADVLSVIKGITKELLFSHENSLYSGCIVYYMKFIIFFSFSQIWGSSFRYERWQVLEQYSLLWQQSSCIYQDAKDSWEKEKTARHYGSHTISTTPPSTKTLPHEHTSRLQWRWALMLQILYGKSTTR